MKPSPLAAVRQILGSSGHGDLALTLDPVEAHGAVYADLFRGEEGGRSFAIKLRNAADWNIVQSLSYFDAHREPMGPVLIPQVIAAGPQVVLISPWIEGPPLLGSDGVAAAEAFRQLARFNRTHPAPGPCTSMYLDGQPFATLADLVALEFEGLVDGYPGPLTKAELWERVAPLAQGEPCWIVEDFNAGNGVWGPDGTLRLIDLDYLIVGHPVYQFEHLAIGGSGNGSWYQFADPDGEATRAFFEELGTEPDLARAQTEAFRVLQELRRAAFAWWQG